MPQAGQNHPLAVESLLAGLQHWTLISDLRVKLQKYFEGPRTQPEVANYRIRTGPFKKLGDEIVPASRFFRACSKHGEVKFNFGAGYPDCWVRDHVSAEPQGIEITVAQAREQVLLAHELNCKGIGRGFLGLPDDAPQHEFDKRLARSRVMYSTEQALSVIGAAIRQRLVRKSASKYAGMTLLIAAPLRSLPFARWDTILRELRSRAATTAFREVFVISNAESTPSSLRIK